MCSILETLNSFNFDVLSYIKGLSLNAIIICIGTQEVACIEVNNRRVLYTYGSAWVGYRLVTGPNQTITKSQGSNQTYIGLGLVITMVNQTYIVICM